MDALSSLSLTREVVDTTSSAVLDLFDSSPLDDLPVMIRFLIHHCTKESAPDIIKRLRQKLHLLGLAAAPSSVSLSQSSRTKVAKESKLASSRCAPVLIVEAVRVGVRFHPFVATAFIQVIQSLEQPVAHKVFDVWVLFMLYRTSFRSKAIALLKKKLEAGMITPALIRLSVSASEQSCRVVHEMFASVLELAEMFLRVSEPRVVDCANRFYVHIFEACDTGFSRQEIIGNLITHIGSGQELEKKAALDVLLNLSRNHPALVRPCLAFIRGILDYLEGFDDSQVRAVFTIFNFLSLGDSDDYIRIVIDKQLTSPIFKYQRMGIIGGVALLIYVPSRINLASSTSRVMSSQAPPLTQADQSQAKRLLDKLHQIAEKSSILSLMYDELSAAILRGDLHPMLVEHLSNFIASEFEANFLIDMEDNKLPERKLVPGITGDSWLSVDGPEGNIVINILPNLCLQGINSSRSSTLCPTFRLLAACEFHSNDGSLGGIDALLGSPLYMFDKRVVDEFGVLTSPQQEVVISALLHALNWIRELIGVFAMQAEHEMRSKVCERVSHMLELEGSLRTCLSHFQKTQPGDFVPLGFVHEATRAGSSFLKQPVEFKEKKKKISSKSKEDLEGKEIIEGKQSKQGQKDKDLKSSKLKVKDSASRGWDLVRPYVRQLDLRSANVLHFSVRLEVASSQNIEPAAEPPSKSPCLEPAAMNFFLQDVCSKICSTFVVSKKPWFATTTAEPVVQTIVKERSPTDMLHAYLSPGGIGLFAALRHHFDAIGRQLSLRSPNDKSEDDNAIAEPISKYEEELLDAITLILRCLRIMLESPLLEGSSGRAKIKILLEEFVTSKKIYNSEDDQAGNEDNILAVSMEESLGELCDKAFRVLQTLAPSLRRFAVSVDLVDTMRVLAFFAKQPDETLVHELGDTAGKVLVTEWLEEKLKGPSLATCVRLFIRHATNPLEQIRKLVGTVLPTILNADAENDNIFGATLNKTTFPHYFVGIAAELTEVFEKAPLPCATATPAEVKLHLKHLVRHSECFLHLSQLCKQLPKNKPVLATTLKQGRVFLETVIKRMAFYEKHFKGNKDYILAFFKNTQQSTRIMQIICAHGKKLKVQSILQNVPAVKKAMEKFIYQIKSFCKANNILNAFWQGNLKHRDMDGKEIDSSQAADEDETESEND